MQRNLALDRCDYEQADHHYQLALQSAETLAAPDLMGKCRNNLGGVALFQGRFAEAIHHLTQAIAAYERICKVAAMAGCRITLAVAHNQAGDHNQALAVLAAAEELLVMRGEILPWQGALLAQACAEAYLALGAWEQAETQVQAALAAEEISVLPDAYRVYGELCWRRGEFAQAEQWLRQAVTLAENNEDRLLTAYAWRTLAHLYGALARWQDASAARFAAVTLFDALQLPHEIVWTEQTLAMMVN